MPTNRNNAVAIAVLLVFIFMCVVCLAATVMLVISMRGNVPPQTQTMTPPTNEVVVPPTETSDWSIVSKSMTKTTSTATINLSYPQLKNYPDAAVQTDFNTKVETAIQKISDEITSLPATGMSELNSANLDFSVALKSDKFISIAGQGSEYTGGAHPNSLIFTFNYDLVAKKQVAVADLFKSGSNYLKLISEFCIAELNARGLGDTGMVEGGAGQKDENFQFFDVTTVGTAGLEMIFPPYQVAPYAAGTQIVSIPVSVFGANLKPEYKSVFGL